MGQLRALLGLRWRMVRSKRTRRGLIALLALIGVLAVQGVYVGQNLPRGSRLFDVLLLAPTMFLVFTALTVVAPLVAGGGNELFPEEQLVAYPIHPRTTFLGSVLVAPLNLAWVTQVLVLVTVTAAVAERRAGMLLALVTTVAFIVMSTVVGQALAWIVIGVRQRASGRMATRLLGVGMLLAWLTVMATGSTTTLLDRSPTTSVVIGAIAGSDGQYQRWGLTTLALIVLGYAGARLGVGACGWTIRRTAPVGRPEFAPVTRRRPRRSALAELITVDQASVWRSTPLRRGAFVLAALPGGVAMLAHPSWASLALLPGLVGAGAGLLFGVNAFCLDGAGAIFGASHPHDPRYTLAAKLLVIAQTCLAAVLLAVALAASQVRGTPTAAELVALTGSLVGTTLVVVAACARLSVERPHKADLRGPRDTPAPPATMAVYSIRLALGTTWVGLAFAAAAASGSVAAGFAASLAVLSLSTRSLLSTFARWRDPDVRSRVVTTVAYG